MVCYNKSERLFVLSATILSYAKKYGPKGVGFGIGAGALSMDMGEQFGNMEVEMT
jgi:hypothetical protein